MEFKEFAKEVNTFNWRTQALTLTFPENKIMIINSYFPTDPKVNEFDTSDLLCMLSAKIIGEFIEEKTLVKSWNKFPADFTPSQETRNRTYTSILDHFFWSERLSE